MTALEQRTETDAQDEISQRGVKPHELDPTKLHGVVVPAGASHAVIDLEKFLRAPNRAKGTYHPSTLDGLVDYATNHRDDEATTAWVDQANNKVVVLLNDHAPGDPGWGDHRVVLQLQPTPEWTHWLSKDGRYLSQEDFAEHLQDGVGEIRVPDAATMLEVAQTIQGKTKADWKTATRLDNGEVSFAYHEEIQASAGRSGHLEIPYALSLSIAPFYGEEPYDLGARLRYRIREGNLSIGYKLERPHEVLSAVVMDIAGRLREDHGFENVYLGTPRA